MSALQQLQEYRQKQAERFKDDDDPEEYKDEQINEIQEMTAQFDAEERQLQEERDREFSQQLERNMNFRESYSSDLEENKVGNVEEYKEDPEQTQMLPQDEYLGETPPFYNNRNRETFTRQEPPRWLVHPAHIDRNNEIKVFDFTEGSTNQELRMTTDSSVNYEYDTMPDPSLGSHKSSDLEAMIHEKQK
mmetsp:Transcript_9694/g.9505  ORF Transcript_9694/g.9505 Transcript_9694/m.9505 type:complete len:190 (-) Transcript_9694:422-991(-)